MLPIPTLKIRSSNHHAKKAKAARILTLYDRRNESLTEAGMQLSVFANVGRRLLGLLLVVCLLSACSTLPKPDDSKSSNDTYPAKANNEQRRAASLRHASPESDLLARIANGFQLPELDSEHVQEFTEWSANHPTYLTNLFTRAEPFLFHIVEQIEARGLPMELALLPAVESAYKSNAVSRSNAVGLWQFIASTGREYGLEQNWWYDGRRDVIASTNAALDYLTVLYNRFDNDWFLALAAYNGGQGNLARSIKANQGKELDTDYLTLDLRLETRRYVPKLIALRNILRNPDQYGVSLPSIANRPTFTEIELRRQVDLAALATKANLTHEQLLQINSGFLRWATPPMDSLAKPNNAAAKHKLKLLVPSTDAAILARVQTVLNSEPAISFNSHRVARGDTLNRIAARYGVSVAALQQANNLNSTTIRLGKTLLVPVQPNKQRNIEQASTVVARATTGVAPQAFSVFSAANASSAQAPQWVDHQVVKGETLWSIAQRYRVSVSDILAWNQLNLEQPLKLNQVLKLFL